MPFKIHMGPIHGLNPPPKQEMTITPSVDDSVIKILEAKAREAEAKAMAEAEARSKAELEARIKQVEAEMRAREENIRLVQQQMDEINALKNEHDSIKALHEEQVAKLEEGLQMIELQDRTLPERSNNVLTVDEIKKRIDEKMAKIEEIQAKAAAGEPISDVYKAPPNTPTLKKKTVKASVTHTAAKKVTPKSSVKIVPMAQKSGGLKRTNSVTSIGSKQSNQSETVKQRWK